MSLFKNILFFVLFISLIINIMNFDFFKEYFKNWLNFYICIYICVILPILMFLLEISKKNEKLKKDTIKIFDDNEYIGEEYNLSIDRIKDIISSINSFFSIGVFGKWGIGKSSFLKNLEKQLTKENYDVIYINVWELENTANILNEVKKEFDNILFKHRPFLWIWYHIKRIFSKNYFSIINNYFIKTNFNIDFAFSPTLREAQKELEYYLNEATDKIVLLIDEIDRLPKEEEVLNVFKIIRYITPFDNVVVISAMDIDKIKIEDKEFIHKIFNLKFEMPLHTKNDLYKYFKNGLNKILAEKYTQVVFNLLDTNYKRKTIIDFIDTYRQIKNILNDINIKTKLICKDTNEDNCNFDDYIDIKFIIVMSILKNIKFNLYRNLIEKNEVVNLFKNFETELLEKLLEKKETQSEKKLEEIEEYIILKILYDFNKEISSSIPVEQQLYIYQYGKIYEYNITLQEFNEYIQNLDKLDNKFNDLAHNTIHSKTEFIKNMISYLYIVEDITNENIKNFIKFIMDNKNFVDIEEIYEYLSDKEILNIKYYKNFTEFFNDVENGVIFFSIFMDVYNKYDIGYNISGKEKNFKIIFEFLSQKFVENIDLLHIEINSNIFLRLEYLYRKLFKLCNKEEINNILKISFDKFIESEKISYFVKWILEELVVLDSINYELREYIISILKEKNLINYIQNDWKYYNKSGKELKEKLKDKDANKTKT